MSNGLYTLHEEQIASRGVSLFVQEVLQDGPLGGIQFFDDLVAADAKDRFTNTGTPAARAEAGGVLRITSSTTINNYVHMVVPNLCSVDKKTAFEVRLKKGDVASSSAGLFAGLCGGSFDATNGPFAGSTSQVLSVEGVGIEIDAASDPDAASLVIRGSGSRSSKGSQAISAGSYIRLGFVIDPASGAHFYVDGVKQAEYHIPSDVNSSVKAPASSSLLNAVISLKSSAASNAGTLDIDWIAVAQAAS